jgi:GAF domain-containing protein
VTALTQLLLESDQPQQSRDLLCETARRLAGADAVYLMEAAGDDLVQTAAACSSGVPAHEPIRHPISGRSLTGQVFTTGEGVFVPDVLDDERTSLAAHQKSGMQAGFFQPVVAADRVVGVLVVAGRTRCPPRRSSPCGSCRCSRRRPGRSSCAWTTSRS